MRQVLNLESNMRLLPMEKRERNPSDRMNLATNPAWGKVTRGLKINGTPIVGR